MCQNTVAVEKFCGRGRGGEYDQIFFVKSSFISQNTSPAHLVLVSSNRKVLANQRGHFTSACQSKAALTGLVDLLLICTEIVGGMLISKDTLIPEIV